MEPYSSDDIKRKRRKNGHGLDRLLEAIPEIASALIVSTEGRPIAYHLPQGTDETKVAAMTAALHSLSERAIIEMGKGDFDKLYIKGREGYLVVSQAGPDAVMAISTTKDIRLGLVLHDIRRFLEKRARSGFDEDDEDDGNFPYPYIDKLPEPPGAPGTVTQLRVKKSAEKELKNEMVCQYCGLTLTEEERLSHNCRKKP
ncbi:MAG: roadblock/LC7 domain-containing protein [Candidatus Lokiarchaeota archaeon]|nr:roadblock/LC7 domain-containing protein [Candidatus Lokiarchaeota archaeon]